MSFFSELKRRNVIKVAAAYIIIGWLIMQAGDTLAPALRLPEWVASLLAFFLILGFPLAIFFAWAYEMTPDGIKKEKDVDKARSIAQATGQKLNYTIIGLLVIALGYFVWESRFDRDGPDVGSELPVNSQSAARSQSTADIITADTSVETPATPTPDKKSIAVIPFRNRSADEENAAFFSDGIHDELLTNLSKIEALKVISRTSVMSYRDTTKNLRQIGGELGVANILEGGVQRAGDKVRINVQLIDAATDEHLWANVYDRQLSTENIFEIQTEIARAIANALEATLSPREQELLSTIPTTNLAAYESLLIARQLLARGNWQSLRDAQSQLQKVIELDPEFTEAYVLLAWTYFNLFSTGAAMLQEIHEPWQVTVQTALSLDENNADAHAVYAQFLWINEMEGIDAAFNKARELEPSNSDIMVMYGAYLRASFEFDRALQLYQAARELDPLSIQVLHGLARIYEAQKELDKALELYATIRKVDPSSSSGYGPVAGLYMDIGDIAQSTKWLFKALAIDPEDSDLSNWIALAYMDFGEFQRARQWLTWIDQTQNVNPMTLAGKAMLNILEGNTDAAIINAREILRNQMPDRWGSDAKAIRTLLIWASENGQVDSALESIRSAHPEFFETAPRINAGNALQAIDTANLLQIKGANEIAENLLGLVISTYEVPYAAPQSWMVTGKAQALALLGDKQAAIKELRQQMDGGWRVFWRWETELNPNFESLREETEFQALVEILRTDMARQLQSLQAMETSGEIPPPPGGDSQ